MAGSNGDKSDGKGPAEVKPPVPDKGSGPPEAASQGPAPAVPSPPSAAETTLADQPTGPPAAATAPVGMLTEPAPTPPTVAPTPPAVVPTPPAVAPTLPAVVLAAPVASAVPPTPPSIPPVAAPVPPIEPVTDAAQPVQDAAPLGATTGGPELADAQAGGHDHAPHAHGTHGAHGSRRLRLMLLGAIGVVYGDIGTSPLYAMHECFSGHGLRPTPENVLGILSLIFWSLVVVVSLKYLAHIMRADNRGEGGILALMALVRPHPEPTWRDKGWILVVVGLFGAALLYGDGMITPAISVLGAMEGLAIEDPDLAPAVVPITLVILLILFLFQYKGTAKVGALFGPIMVVWFVVLAVMGVRGLLLDGSVLQALSPHFAVEFFFHNGWHGFLVLGGVFLVVTGGEALYADMGHFGIRPIRLAWFCLVFPALMIHYMGQGALLLHDPTAVTNPFYLLAPSWALYPLLGLALAAAIIASQAVITGAFSITRQAVQLGYAPRTVIEHTSAEEIGQIYVPQINWFLLISTMMLVLAFRSATNLAAAYGVAVTGTMAITTLLAYFVATRMWKWSKAKALILTVGLLVVDLAFFGANLVKIFDGGWFPLLVGAAGFTILATWRRGRIILGERVREIAQPLGQWIEQLGIDPPVRVPGTAIFMTSSADIVPPSMVQNLKHNQVLHERVLLITSTNLEVPQVTQADRVTVVDLGHGVFRVRAQFGFMEDPTIQEILRQCKPHGLEVEVNEPTYFLGRETILATSRPGMAIWREKLFGFLSNNQQRALAFFRIPPDRVIEIGWQVEL